LAGAVGAPDSGAGVGAGVSGAGFDGSVGADGGAVGWLWAKAEVAAIRDSAVAPTQSFWISIF
jgi:hypothetical protein